MTQPQVTLPQWTPEAEAQLMAAWQQQFGTQAPPAPVGTPSFERAQAAAQPTAPTAQAAPAPAAAAPIAQPPAGGAGLGDAVRAALRVAVGLAVVAGVGYVSYLAWQSFAGHAHTPQAPAQPVGADVADA